MVNNVSHRKLYKQVMNLLDNNNFLHKEINVNNYSPNDFYDVLLSELLINTRLVLENERINNLSSMGVDVCCRVIIEICALLEADKSGNFTDNQKKLFLLEYLGPDIQKQQNKIIHEELKSLLKSPYDKLIGEYRAIIGCNEEEAEKIVSKRRAFLEYGGEMFPHFNGFVKRYLGEEYTAYREKLSVFIHPSYTESRNFLVSIPGIESKREKIINKVLTLAYEYMPVVDSQAYLKSRWNDEVVDEYHLSLMSSIEDEFWALFKKFEKKEIWKDTILDHDSARKVISSSIRKLCAVLIDCLMCESLGLSAQVVARAKSYIEMTSLLGYFIGSNNIVLDTKSFYYTSIMTYWDKEQALHEILKKVDKGIELKEIEQDIYNKRIGFYKEWYQELKEENYIPVSEEEFVREAPKSLIYYINQDWKNYRYRDLVEDMIKHYISFGDRKRIRELLCDYDFSAKLGHASAYKSKLKENKIFSLIPNMIHFLTSVLDDLIHIDAVAIFVDRMNSIKEQIEMDTKNKYNSVMNQTYKKMI